MTPNQKDMITDAAAALIDFVQEEVDAKGNRIGVALIFVELDTDTGEAAIFTDGMTDKDVAVLLRHHADRLDQRAANDDEAAPTDRLQ